MTFLICAASILIPLLVRWGADKNPMAGPPAQLYCDV